MFKVTRFCVQPYVRRGGQLQPDQAEQFHQPESAMERARRLRRRVAGVAVYRVDGWPVQDLWGRPRLIAKAGDVLDLA